MICNKCGAWVEPGDAFCGSCGAKVTGSAAGYTNAGSGQPGGGSGQPGGGTGYPNSRAGYPGGGTGYPNNRAGYPAGGMGYPNSRSGYPAGGMGYPNSRTGYPDNRMLYTPPSNRNITHSGAGLAKKPDIAMIIAGCAMLLASFLPLVKVNLGKIAELASQYLGEFIPGMFNKIQFNIYSLVGFVGSDPYDLGIPGYVKALLIVAIIFMLATIAVSIVAGIIGNRSLKIMAGVMSITCLVVCIIYMILMGILLSKINQEIAASLGDYGSLLGGTLKIKSLNGIGLYLFMVASAVQSVFSIKSATKPAVSK